MNQAQHECYRGRDYLGNVTRGAFAHGTQVLGDARAAAHCLDVSHVSFSGVSVYFVRRFSASARRLRHTTRLRALTSNLDILKKPGQERMALT